MFSKAKGAFTGAFTGAFSSEEKIKQGDEEGDSLVTILKTEEDRGALTILIADCTEAMRQSIVDIFDAKQTGKPADMVVDLKVDDAAASPDDKSDPSNEAVQAKMKKEQAQRDKELSQREKELSSAQMKDLKESALHYFDEWRTSVILRVGEIVNSKEEAKKEVKNADPRPSSPEKISAPMRYPEPPAHDPGVGEVMKQIYPPIDNNLRHLPEAKKALILHSVLLLLLSLENYQSYSRTLLLRLTTSLDLSISFLATDEGKVARGLLAAVENMQADEETKKRAEDNHDSRKWKVGIATVAGAALIGVTGGLAAPLLAAGVGTVMGGLGLGATAAAGYLGTLAGSTVLVGGLFGAYGGRMTGKVMDQYAREVEDFAFVPIRAQHKPRKIEKEYRRLRVAIGISGWLGSEDDVVAPWKPIGSEMESFALRWELEALMNLGNSLTTMIKSAAWSFAKSEIISRTVFAALTAGLWPLALVKVSKIIDNPWSVANYRAQKAGEVLADALINKAQGERPVTLIGFSLGAKVVYACLQRLAERRAFGLVESAVMIGAPTPSTAADWRRVRAVVSGRVVNVYSTQDYILGFLYRGSSIQLGVAGLQAVENVKGVENVDVSDMVTGHTSYRFLTGVIMRKIGFEDVDDAELQKEEAERKKVEEKEEQERKQSEQAEEAKAPPTEQLEKTKLDSATDKVKGAFSTSKSKPHEVSDQHVQELEQEVEQKNQQSYMSWAQGKMAGAGDSASEAYGKAKSQWSKPKSGGGQKATGDMAGSVASMAMP